MRASGLGDAPLGALRVNYEPLDALRAYGARRGTDFEALREVTTHGAFTLDAQDAQDAQDGPLHFSLR